MTTRRTTFFTSFFLIFFLLKVHPSHAKTWIQAGYWYSGSEFPVAGINSVLFTHLYCAFASVNSSTYELSIASSDVQSFSDFTETVERRNPKITTLLSIGGGITDPDIFSKMAKTHSNRKSFIDSTIRTARTYGFHGLDLMWVSPVTVPDMNNLETLIQEWREAVEADAKNTSRKRLILTAAVEIYPIIFSAPYPVITMDKNLDWVNVMAYEYHLPSSEKRTGAFAALYDPTGDSNTDEGIKQWLSMGISAKKLVLGFPYHGYAWKLANPREGYIGAEAKGPAITEDGSMRYVDVKDFMRKNGVDNESVYNESYVVNYVTVGSTWIAFDDVESVKTKVSYAKENKLLGYYAWQVSSDDSWVLSLAAHGMNGNQQSKRRIITLISTISATIIMLLIAGLAMYYQRTRMLRSKDEELKTRSRRIITSGDSSDSNELNNLQVFGFTEIEEATNRFSFENKLGEGGFGPVYKGTLRNGMAIAVKKLSKSSKQGFEEFKNEVSLTAKLQHINLVRVLGFCIQRDEQMLIYEYMPNKSLDFYIFDHSKRLLLDWEKRVKIIEGVTQGLLYLQEYSRLTIIHRDLKAGNILLDDKMNAKISDFGMAKIFAKDKHEENTDRIVGTYGYAPPEYLREGVYSTKSDVYSFGILLLQIISGKKNVYQYGPNEDMHLLDYGYELWKEGKEMEFVDLSLDDRFSTCKLNRCLQIGLLCVQENASDRPSMLDISSMLKNEIITIATPKKPAFSKKKGQENQQNYIPGQQPDRVSVNTVTLSVFDGR